MRMTQRNALLKEVSSRGIRLTRQRRALIEALQSAEEHVDAAGLLELARKRDPDIDRATVYRTLDILKKLRLIDELDLMHLQGEKHYFEPRTLRDHCHLACFRCGSIVEYASPAFEALKKEIAKENSFQVDVIRLELGGVCRDCSETEGGSGKRSAKICPG
jgi:Fur family ferric uptake transcriptional regulator